MDWGMLTFRDFQISAWLTGLKQGGFWVQDLHLLILGLGASGMWALGFQGFRIEGCGTRI